MKTKNHLYSGFISIPAVVAGVVFVVGSLVVGLTVNQVTNLTTTQDVRSKAASCDSYGVCTTPIPTPLSCAGGTPHGSTACYSATSCKVCDNGLFKDTNLWNCPTNSFCYKPQSSSTPTPTPTSTPNNLSCDGSCINVPYCSLVNMVNSSGSCGSGAICCKSQNSSTSTPTPTPTPTSNPAFTLSSSCSKINAACFKKGIQTCTLGGQTGTQMCDFNACDDALSCSENPTNCSACVTAATTSLSVYEITGLCKSNSDCPSGNHCDRKIGECLPIEVSTSPSPTPTPTPYAGPLVSNGAGCANNLIPDGTHFCFGNTCMKCDNGMNIPAGPSECGVSNLNPVFGGTSCAPKVTTDSNPYYCSQVASSIRNTPKYPGCSVTFGKAGCGETVVSMLAAEKTGGTCDPAAIASTYYNASTACDGTTGTDHYPALQALGIEYSPVKGLVTKDKVINYLNEGWEAMMGCSINGINHYTLAREVINGEIVFSDPYFGDGTTSGQQIEIKDYSGCEVTLVKT